MTTHDLRVLCSRYFTLGDLIECGETWNRLNQAGTPIPNVPMQDETFKSLTHLAREVLDPLHENFGRIVITYGFASLSLTKQIHGRIAPKVDQHAGSETNAKKNLICVREGQSCDFLIPDVNSLVVGQWVHANLPFDRMYLYGSDRPLHVSVSPKPLGRIYAMVPNEQNRIPHDATQRSWVEISRLFRSP